MKPNDEKFSPDSKKPDTKINNKSKKAVENTSNPSPNDTAKKAEESKEILQKREQAKKEESQKPSPAVSTETGQRTVKCPACSELNRVKVKNAGKYIFSITFPFTKYTLNIPNPLAFLGKIVTHDQNLKNGKKCELCQGKKKVVDVTDDSAKYQQAREQLERQAEKIIEEESKLGEGGHETINIQGSYVLNVGSGFNTNKSYTQKEGGSSAPAITGNTNSPQGVQVPANSVHGKQAELGWPQHIGNFLLTCGNKFKVLAGGGGITLSTEGPLTLKGGIIRFVGPSMTIGSQDGPLSLEGETVTVGGKNIVMAPTSGQTYFRGTVAATGNAIVSGHTHSEGLSFIRATCPGVNKESSMDQANKDTTKTEAPTWSFKATAGALLETILFTQAIPSSVDNVKRIIAVEGVQSLLDRISHIIKVSLPLCNLMQPTGICLNSAGFGVIWNFPHHHGIPNLHHTHNTKVPDITLEDTPEAVRAKVYNGALTGGSPANLTEDGGARKLRGLMKIAESIYGLLCEGLNYASRVFKKI